jgi:isocitrate/isopropylmalate dehydrogenase
MTESKTYRIVVLPGDGIGPEIVDAALEVLETVQQVCGGFSLSYGFHRAGAGCYRETGESKAAAGLEAALWRVYAERRIPLKAAGTVEGGAPLVANAIKQALLHQ